MTIAVTESTLNGAPRLFSHKSTWSTESRSTCDGDAPSCSDVEQEAYSGLRTAGDPYLYPAPFIVRNTFLDCRVERDPSLDGFLLERQIRSSPPGRNGEHSELIFSLGPKITTVHSQTTSEGDSSSDCEDKMDDDYFYPRPLPARNARSLNTSEGDVSTDSVDKNACISSATSSGDEGDDEVSRQHSGRMRVRNTFIDIPTGHLPWGSFKEREVRSAPSSGVAHDAIVGSAADAASDLTAFGSFEALTSNVSVSVASTFDKAVDGAVGVANSALGFWTSLWAAEPEPAPQAAPVELPPRNRPCMVLSLADVLGEPELGSPEFPSIGSAGHRLGTCKPCAFLERGCSSGVNCNFCHSCEPTEKKRRRKEKAAYIRSLRRASNVMKFQEV